MTDRAVPPGYYDGGFASEVSIFVPDPTRTDAYAAIVEACKSAQPLAVESATGDAVVLTDYQQQLLGWLAELGANGSEGRVNFVTRLAPEGGELPKRGLTSQEAAARLGVSAATVRRFADEDKFCQQRAGSSRIICAASVAGLIRRTPHGPSNADGAEPDDRCCALRWKPQSTS